MFLVKHISKIKSPFFVGFIISLLGALPLGYINVIDLQILLDQGTLASSLFILGIVFIEFFVLKITSAIASWLISQKKLVLFIEWFTLIFFLIIGYYFFININNQENFSTENLPLFAYPFLLGIFLNALNFIQWPYWSGVYVLLYQNNILEQKSKENHHFIYGAMVGTFVGMTFFAQIGYYFVADHRVAFSYYLNTIFALLFLGIGVFQLINTLLKTKKKIVS